jgi:hypothetical protein
MNQATSPFQFVAASYLIRICPQRAWTLAELVREMGSVPDASVFYHTFQTQETHHYTAYSNDFAQWVDSACKVPALGEALAAMDLREFASVEQLRSFLIRAVEQHLRSRPQDADEPAYEPFYFCEALPVVVPLEAQAWNLAELAAGIATMSPHTLHHHFINSRLREPLRVNDFSHWIDTALGLPQLARAINQIDFHMNSLGQVRQDLLHRIQSWKT